MNMNKTTSKHAIVLLLICGCLLFYLSPPIHASQTVQSNLTEKPPVLVMLHFDDSYRGVYENAFPILEEYGYKATLFVPTNFIDREKHMTLEQLVELKEANWTIGSHSRTHPDLRTLDQTTLFDEVVGSRNTLIGNGLTELESAYFCSPMTTWNPYVALMVSKNYQAARAKELIIFDTDIQPEQHIRVILKDTTLQTIKQWIKEAETEGSWLILVFHEVADGGNEYFFPPTRFPLVLDLLKETNAQVTTLDEAVTIWREYLANL